MSEEKLTMEDYASELEASFKKIAEGDIITGTVVAVTDEEVILDLKYYAEGIIPLADYTREPGFNVKEAVQPGEEVSAMVVQRDDGHGNILLSRIRANDILAWEKLQQLKKDGTVLNVKIKEAVNAGVITYVEGICGFIPASRLSLTRVDNLEEYVNKTIQVQVFEVKKNEHRLILSARELLRAAMEKERKALISNVEVGLVTEGTVEDLKPYGAFIALGNGLSGMVHVSQISQKRIKFPSAVLSVGDKVKVKVTAIKDGKISLSMKALEETEAEEIQEEPIELPQSEELTTTLGSLFKNLKF